MMKRGTVLLLALLGCGPNFESGKTECSDSLECPSGYACGSEQKGSTPVCYAKSIAYCSGSTPFFCKWAGVCAAGPAQCPGAGGDVGSCTDPSFPVSCPAVGGVSAGCWGAGADCSTIASCGVDDSAACPTGRKVYCGGDKSRRCCVPPEAGGTCSLPACGCPIGQVCALDTKATGLACMASTGLTDGMDCSGATDVCAEGFGCFGSLCKRYCKTNSDCPAVDGASACKPTYWETDIPVPGVSVCVRVCDPVSPQKPRIPLLACPAGFGCFSAVGNPGASNCIPQNGTRKAGEACSPTEDCAPGYYCATDDLCYKYCFTNSDCPSGKTCNYYTTPEYAGRTQVGYCN